MIVQQIANSGNDEFYTPIYAIEPILKYLKPNSNSIQNSQILLKD